jgi:O-antigen/teichoic acid export membrane protein
MVGGDREGRQPPLTGQRRWTLPLSGIGHLFLKELSAHRGRWRVPKLTSFGLNSDLFATVFTFAVQGAVKLGSSVVMTRMLRPEAWGVITILMAILFVVEMIADMALTVVLIRHEKGDDPRYVNTAWTLRFMRAVLNGAVVFFGAPLIAHLYASPELTAPLRVSSLWFPLAALESMSFPMAIRRKNSRIVVYAELTALIVSTIFTILYTYYSRDFWGMVYGTLLNRGLMSLMSYRVSPELRPRLQLDRQAARDLLDYSRLSMPSSLLTLALSQFDKVVLLRLFDLHLLGLYGVASNIASQVEALIEKISHLVLYPRCADEFRINPGGFSAACYRATARQVWTMLLPPALVGGGARLLIAILYDARYAQTGPILQALMLRVALLAVAAAPLSMLVAAGVYRSFLVGNVYRCVATVVGAVIGYYLFGFMGFVYGTALNALPPLLYFLWMLRKQGFLIVKYEFHRVAFFLAVATSTYLLSDLLLRLLPAR